MIAESEGLRKLAKEVRSRFDLQSVAAISYALQDQCLINSYTVGFMVTLNPCRQGVELDTTRPTFDSASQ